MKIRQEIPNDYRAVYQIVQSALKQPILPMEMNKRLSRNYEPAKPLFRNYP